MKSSRRDRPAPLPVGSSFDMSSEGGSESRDLAASLKDLALKYWAKGDTENALRVGQEALEVLRREGSDPGAVTAIESMLEEIARQAPGEVR